MIRIFCLSQFRRQPYIGQVNYDASLCSLSFFYAYGSLFAMQYALRLHFYHETLLCCYEMWGNILTQLFWAFNAYISGGFAWKSSCLWTRIAVRMTASRQCLRIRGYSEDFRHKFGGVKQNLFRDNQLWYLLRSLSVSCAISGKSLTEWIIVHFLSSPPMNSAKLSWAWEPNRFKNGSLFGTMLALVNAVYHYFPKQLIVQL